MKCDVIRDLFPSYIDGLTSQASVQLIEEHLEGCRECRSCLEKMKSEWEMPEDAAVNQAAAKPFRKLHRAIWKAVAVTVLICAAVAGGWSYYFGHGWTPDSSEVKLTYEKSSQGVVTLGFLPKEDGVYFNVEVVSNQPDIIVIRAYHANPIDPPIRTGGYFGYTFLDENTILKTDGTGMKLASGDELTIRYGDQTQTVSIRELAEDRGLKQSSKAAED